MGSGSLARTSPLQDRRQPPLHLLDRLDRPEEIPVVAPDGDDVVGVVGDRRGEGPLLQAEPLHKPDADPPRRPVALHDDQLQDVPAGIGDDHAVPDGRLQDEPAGQDLIGNEADHPDSLPRSGTRNASGPNGRMFMAPNARLRPPPSPGR